MADSKGSLSGLTEEEAKEFHREKIREREKAEGRKMDYTVAVEDLWAFSKGKMLGKPNPV